MAIKELFQDSRPQVLFDPRASQRIDPRFKFTRDGTAAYVDREGFIRTAAANEPRLDYDPVSNELNGLLVEESRTNKFVYSTDLTNPTWSGYEKMSAASVTSPDGLQNAYKLTASAVAEAQGWGEDIGSANAPTTKAFFSVWLKAAGYRYVAVGGSAFTIKLRIDLQTGTVFQRDSLISPDSFVEAYKNGWYRVCVSYTTPGNHRYNFVNILNSAYTGSSSTSSEIEFAGDGTSGIYIWAPQLEVGTVPTSYIPTPGNATVTREPDLLSIEGISLPSTGSIYIDARSLTSDVDDTLLSAANASDDKLTLAIRQPANLYNSKALVYEVDGAFKPTLPFPVPGVTRERNLITYGANNYHYRSDSSRLTPSSSSSVPTNMTRLGVGHDVTDPTKAISGYINTVYLWPGEITPTVAEALVRGDVDPQDADAGVFTPETGALAFVFNTQGTATDGDRVVELPLGGSTNNILVDWGDNTSSSFIGAAADSTVSHTYAAAGIYPVQITADDDGTNSGLENLQFYTNSSADLVRVLQWGGTTMWQPTTMFRAFRNCTQLDFENAARTNLPDTSAITDWRDAFYECTSLTGQFPAFDTSAATNFSSTWYNCSGVTSYPKLQTGNVTNFYRAWWNNSSLVSFPTIDTSSGTTFGGGGVGNGAWFGCSSLTNFPLLDFSSAITLAGAWAKCSSLTSFPAINTASVTSFGSVNPRSGAWEGCSSLINFPLIDTSNATSLARAWYGCSSLAGAFPNINTSNCQDFYNTWNDCSSLTSFPALDFSSATGRLGAGTSGDGTWRNCSGLTSFPFIDISGINGSIAGAWAGCSGLTSFPLLDFSNVVLFGEVNQGAFEGCTSLTSFPAIDTGSGTSFFRAWMNCTSLTSFPSIDTSNATDITGAWHNCNSLTSFPSIDTSNVIHTTSASATIRGPWSNCSSLTSFPALDLSNATALGGSTNGGAWVGCSSLTSFPTIDFASSTTFQRCWYGCTSLADFGANCFDNSPGVNFTDAFTNCALTATSVENILVSINTANTSNGTLGINGGATAGASTWTTAATNAYNALVSRGWTITRNP